MTIWVATGSLALALGWLLPNHQLPWTTFHSDVWVAGLLLVFSWASLLKLKKPLPWSRVAVFVAVLSVIPLIQLSLGHVKLAGTAWIGSAYLVGFCLAILTGSHWESARPSELMNVLFLAIVAAAIASVSIQLCQWLTVSGGCFCSANWVNLASNSNRASANLGQPNQLATLLIWGVLACCWAWIRQEVSAAAVITIILFLLFGIALTGSRSGMLSLSMMTLCAWRWAHLWPSRRIWKVATILFFFYLTIVWLLPILSHALLLDYSTSIISRTKYETRLDIWAMFLNALWHQPWFGYGWDQIMLTLATPAVALSDPLICKGMHCAHTHNLFLDFLMWLGIPLGLTVVAVILFWVGRAMMCVKNSGDALLVMFVLAVGLHAMLELPIHHAYFLLPLGLVVGVIDIRLQNTQVFFSNFKSTILIWLVATLLFAVIVRDYFLVEESYNELRLEKSRVLSKVQRLPPDVLLLTQLRDFIILARLQPSPPMTIEQVEWIRKVALTYPNPPNLLKLATALALKGQTLEAQNFLKRLCVLSRAEQCAFAKTSWLVLQSKFPQLEAVNWPSQEK